MPPTTAFARVALLLLLTAASIANAENTTGVLEKTVSYRILLGSDGKLVSATPLDASVGMDLLKAGVGLAKNLKFEPAKLHGKPVSAETTLVEVVQFSRQPDGSYQLGVKSAWLAPEAIQQTPPSLQVRRPTPWPTGAIVLGVVVLPDGSVDASRITVLQSAVSGDDPATLALLTKASRDAALQWKFKPDLVAGQPVSTMVKHVMRFCASGMGGCDKSSIPTPSAEVRNLPKSMSAGVELPVLRHASTSASAVPDAQTYYSQWRIAVDAGGTVTALRPVGTTVAADALEAARRRLQSTRFLPARAAGKPVASEMTVTVPVRDERPNGGTLQVQIERINYDFQLTSAPFPWLPPEFSANQIDARARFLVVIGADGRADMERSRVEKVELSSNLPIMRRRLEDGLREAIRRIRVEQVLVDGKLVPISFTRGLYFCSNTVRPCAFSALDEETQKAVRQPPKLPDGIEMARVAF